MAILSELGFGALTPYNDHSHPMISEFPHSLLAGPLHGRLAGAND